MTTKIHFQDLATLKQLYDGNKTEVVTHQYKTITKAAPSWRPSTWRPITADRLREMTDCAAWMASLRKIQLQQHIFRFKCERLVILNIYHCIVSSKSTSLELREDWMNKIFLCCQTPNTDHCMSIFILPWQHQCTLQKESQMSILVSAIKSLFYRLKLYSLGFIFCFCFFSKWWWHWSFW